MLLVKVRLHKICLTWIILTQVDLVKNVLGLIGLAPGLLTVALTLSGPGGMRVSSLSLSSALAKPLTTC